MIRNQIIKTSERIGNGHKARRTRLSLKTRAVLQDESFLRNKGFLRKKGLRHLLCFLSVMLLGNQSLFAESKLMCIYDPVGANGPVYNQMKDYRTAALAWGVRFELKPYTDERIAAEDFKAKICDAALITGFKAKEFNQFTGTLDAIGALPSYKHVKTLYQMLSGPKAAKLMVKGAYEVGGVYPAGAAYLYVNDRLITTVQDLSGKRIGILETDASQRELVINVGASPVNASIARLYSTFNNGVTDIVPGPAVVFETMELYKGLEPKGGIIDFPLGQLNIQIVFRSESFPEGFGQKSRAYVFSEFDTTLALVKSSEDSIPERWWVRIPPEDRTGYIEMLRQARLSLRKKQIYNDKTLLVMRKMRCKLEPAQPECTAVDRE